MQAVYDPENVGHFGLGFDAYTHFTSPIRRYPDLMVHRAIRHLIRSKKSPHLKKAKGAPNLAKKDIYPYSMGELNELGVQLSAAERRADAASYDVIDWLKCEYIQQHIGDAFDGTVVSVNNFGIFVELDDIHIEGLIHVTALRNDYYHFDQVAHSLTGERTGESFHLGDRVHVQVSRVDMDGHKIDLQLLQTLEKTRSSAPVPKRNKSSGKGKSGSGQRQVRKKKVKSTRGKNTQSQSGKAEAGDSNKSGGSKPKKSRSQGKSTNSRRKSRKR